MSYPEALLRNTRYLAARVAFAVSEECPHFIQNATYSVSSSRMQSLMRDTCECTDRKKTQAGNLRWMGGLRVCLSQCKRNSALASGTAKDIFTKTVPHVVPRSKRNHDLQAALPIIERHVWIRNLLLNECRG